MGERNTISVLTRPNGGDTALMTDINYTSADGLRLFAKAYGNPDATLTVLCMHGLTRNHKDFEPMIDALDGRYRFVAVDVRGRGQSDRASDHETYAPQHYAADMAALLEHLKISRFVMIGTSMGGLIAMILSKMMPDRVRGVILNDVGPVVERSGLDRIAAYAGKVEAVAGWSEATKAVAKVQRAAFPHYGVEDWKKFAKRTYRRLGDGQLIVDYDPQITNSLGDSHPGLLTRIAMWRLFSSMKKIPLLVLRGETSDILSKKTARRMIKRHKDAQLVEVPGVGHAPMLDEPAAVSSIANFLNRLETGE